jgi:hypothetical protein
VLDDESRKQEEMLDQIGRHLEVLKAGAVVGGLARAPARALGAVPCPGQHLAVAGAVAGLPRLPARLPGRSTQASTQRLWLRTLPCRCALSLPQRPRRGGGALGSRAELPPLRPPAVLLRTPAPHPAPT